MPVNPDKIDIDPEEVDDSCYEDEEAGEFDLVEAENKEEAAEESAEEEDSKVLKARDAAMEEPVEEVETEAAPTVQQSAPGSEAVLDEITKLLLETSKLLEETRDLSKEINEHDEKFAEELVEAKKFLEESTKLNSQQKRHLQQALANNTLEVVKQVSGQVQEEIAKLAEESHEHLQSLEKEAIERNRRFLKTTMPEKVLNYVRTCAFVGLALMSCAWLLEKVIPMLL